MIKGKRVAILVADGFEQVELTEPRKALDEAGAKTQIVSNAPVDQSLVSSRKPQDIPAFNRQMLALFGQEPAAAH